LRQVQTIVACREGIEDVVLSKRRFTYEQEIAQNPLNYDAWFDYVKLEESTGNHDRIREVCLDVTSLLSRHNAESACCVQLIM
jgi:crooked neck